MMTEDSMSGGGGVPHVRKATSRAGSSNMTHATIGTTGSDSLAGGGGGSGSGGNYTGSDSLSIEPGNSEPSVTTTSGKNNMNMTAPQQAMTPLLQQQHQHHHSLPTPTLRTSSSLYQNHHNYTSNTMDWYRFYDIRSMDIQSALDQMKTLLSVWSHSLSGSNGSNKSQTLMIYKLAYYRKQTKNHWYRDDPTFILLQILMLFISCITYSIAFKISLLHSISFIIISILFNYLFIGIIVTTILREFTNRHLLTHHQHTPTSSNITSTTTTATSTHIQKQQVEWLYAFDIHCNSFFPLFIVLCT
jgi:hypothetical protein